jgi:hypothetical protein
MPDSETVDALQEIYPESVTVELASGPVEMRPLSVEHLGAMSRVACVILAMLGSSEDEMVFLEARSGDLLPFLAASSGIDREKLRKAYGGHFMQLLDGALEANLDFFARRFAYLHGNKRAKLLEMLNGLGLRRYITSETADTPIASDTPPQDSGAS